MIVTTIFVTRNTSRLINENKLYDYNLFKDSRYKFIGGDVNFYFRYNKYMQDKRNYSFVNFLGKNFIILEK